MSILLTASWIGFYLGKKTESELNFPIFKMGIGRYRNARSNMAIWEIAFQIFSFR